MQSSSKLSVYVFVANRSKLKWLWNINILCNSSFLVPKFCQIALKWSLLRRSMFEFLTINMFFCDFKKNEVFIMDWTRTSLLCYLYNVCHKVLPGDILTSVFFLWFSFVGVWNGVLWVIAVFEAFKYYVWKLKKGSQYIWQSTTFFFSRKDFIM